MTKSVSSALTRTADPTESAATPVSEAQNRHIVRWYVMVYPTSSRAMTEELDRELTRRRRDNEPLFEYFAPVLVEARKMNGRLVTTQRSLLYNYLFVHASEAEIYRIKQRLPQYNLLPRVKDSEESYHYPYLTDKAMRDLQWIARSYAEPVPVCTPDPAWLAKGDRIRIAEGRFAGIEARVVTNAPSRHKEILVSIDDWMCVPLLKVQPGAYEVIELNAENPGYYSRLNNSKLFDRIHDALCRHWAGTGSAEDRRMATEVLQEYGSLTLDPALQTPCVAAAGLHDSRGGIEARKSTPGHSGDAPGRACRTIPGPVARNAVRLHGQSALLRSGTRPDRSLARGRVAQEEQGPAYSPPG